MDESGQDTFGKLYLVSVVITGNERETLRKKLRAIEIDSKKKNKKWVKSRAKQRIDYIKKILNLKEFVRHVYYSDYKDIKAYTELTVLTTAKAVNECVKGKSYRVTVLVDGLKKSERKYFMGNLRKLNIVAHKVRGVKDENDEFIRLADAIVGLIRGSRKGNKETSALLRKAKKQKIIMEI